MRGKHALVIMALALAACRSPAPTLAPPADTLALRLGATESTIQLARGLAQEFAAARSGQRILAYIPLTPYTAALNAAADGTDPPAYTLVKYLPPDSPLWAAPVGQDRLVIIAHAGLQSQPLSRMDLQALFSGRVTNWAVLGGTDLPVTVVSRDSTSAGYAAFAAAIMGQGLPLAEDARLATSYDAVFRILKDTPGAIGYAPASSLPADAHRLETSLPAAALETTLYITGPGEPQGGLRDFIAWIQSPAGQAVLARMHIPIFAQ